VLLKGIYPLKPSESISRKDVNVLVICGGVTSGGTVSRRVEIYNPISNSWTRGTDMPEVELKAIDIS
jgi:hypothetical protein